MDTQTIIAAAAGASGALSLLKAIQLAKRLWSGKSARAQAVVTAHQLDRSIHLTLNGEKELIRRRQEETDASVTALYERFRLLEHSVEDLRRTVLGLSRD